MNMIRLIAITLPMTLLLACGGGGGSSGSTATPSTTPMTGNPNNPTTMGGPNIPVTTPTITLPDVTNPQNLPGWGIRNVEAARTNIGGTSPAVTTYSEIINALRTRATGSDTLLFPVVRSAGGGGLSASGLISPDCNGTSCTVPIPDIGDPTFSLAEIYDPSLINDGGLDGYNAEVQPIAVANGVTLIQGRGAARNNSGTAFTFRTYSGWTDGSVFGVGDIIVTANNTTTNRFTSYSFGNDSGNNPKARGSETSASWEGVAVGRRDNIVLQGSVSIDIDNLSSPNPDVDVAISGFLTSNQVETGGISLNWENIPLENGKFQREGAADYLYIRGSFYGENHEEVGGVFSNTNYYGAFGATRQP